MQPDQFTANDRFKKGNGTRTWSAIALAVLVHFGAFLLWPAATPDVLGATTSSDSVVMVAPPAPPLPQPPEPIPPPANPLPSFDAPPTATLPPTDIWTPPATALPPVRRDEVGTAPEDFVPVTVRPSLANGDALLRELRRRYPPPLRDVGLEGTVVLWVRVTEDGGVVDARVKETSGHDLFDEVALDVAQLMRFRPAQNLDRPVSVWVAIPVTFQLR
jgi:protein TonB